MPSNKTATGGTSKPTLAIRWVFPTSRGLLTHLADERIGLGRDDDCQVKLLGKECSRHHAEIRREGPLHIVKDLGSRNGIFVNGAKVQESPIRPGQVLRMGEWIGIVIQVSPDVADHDPVFDLLAANLAGGPVLRPILEQAKKAASSALPTVILGETGTGKEGLAHAMHEWSGRKGPFLAVNCATLVPTLAEAELFGYRKGAFTGADRASPGFFRAAQGGTLLLDEVTDLPEPVQAKFLRALEQREISPLGESAPVRIDVRVLAATQIPLAKVVDEHRFRADLCARLNGLTIRLPPLRERKQEIAFLFLHLLRLHAGGRPSDVEPRLVEQLCLHDWPFNVRELDLLARRLLVLHGHEEVLRRSHLPEEILNRPETGAPVPAPVAAVGSGAISAAPNTPESHRARRERELSLLTEALRTHKGSVARAAAAVGISRQRAYRLMEAGGISGVGDDLAPGESQ
jgi:transcriptional regulator with PAS, ATPase and Fis domain